MKNDIPKRDIRMAKNLSGTRCLVLTMLSNNHFRGNTTIILSFVCRSSFTNLKLFRQFLSIYSRARYGYGTEQAARAGNNMKRKETKNSIYSTPLPELEIKTYARIHL